jgi:hypothetical protein
MWRRSVTVAPCTTAPSRRARLRPGRESSENLLLSENVLKSIRATLVPGPDGAGPSREKRSGQRLFLQRGELPDARGGEFDQGGKFLG